MAGRGGLTFFQRVDFPQVQAVFFQMIGYIVDDPFDTDENLWRPETAIGAGRDFVRVVAVDIHPYVRDLVCPCRVDARSPQNGGREGGMASDIGVRFHLYGAQTAVVGDAHFVAALDRMPFTGPLDIFFSA